MQVGGGLGGGGGGRGRGGLTQPSAIGARINISTYTNEKSDLHQLSFYVARTSFD